MGKLLFKKLIGKKPTLSNTWTFSSIKEVFGSQKIQWNLLLLYNPIGNHEVNSSKLGQV
jgi:hypothetical protein